jgi:hypothetical protein
MRFKALLTHFEFCGLRAEEGGRVVYVYWDPSTRAYFHALEESHAAQVRAGLEALLPMWRFLPVVSKLDVLRLSTYAGSVIEQAWWVLGLSVLVVISMLTSEIAFAFATSEQLSFFLIYDFIVLSLLVIEFTIRMSVPTTASYPHLFVALDLVIIITFFLHNFYIGGSLVGCADHVNAILNPSSIADFIDTKGCGHRIHTLLLVTSPLKLLRVHRMVYKLIQWREEAYVTHYNTFFYIRIVFFNFIFFLFLQSPYRSPPRACLSLRQQPPVPPPPPRRRSRVENPHHRHRRRGP